MMLTTCLLTLLLQSLIVQAHAADIVVTITGIDKSVGTVQLVLFDNPEAFPDDEQASVQQLTLAAEKELVIARLTDVLPGTYAISVFHDANSNGFLDRNFTGAPIEEYGFSNNVHPPQGIPSFAEAAFTVETFELELMIELQ